MFIIITIIFVAISFLIILLHGCRKYCNDPEPRHPYGEPQGPMSPPLPPMPALPSLPGGTIPVGLEPPPYNEVTAKPFLYPPPQGPCPECGHCPEAQPSFTPQTSF